MMGRCVSTGLSCKWAIEVCSPRYNLASITSLFTRFFFLFFFADVIKSSRKSSSYKADFLLPHYYIVVNQYYCGVVNFNLCVRITFSRLLFHTWLLVCLSVLLRERTYQHLKKKKKWKREKNVCYIRLHSGQFEYFLIHVYI